MNRPDKRSDIAFTPAVKRAQQLRGSRDSYRRATDRRDFSGTITDELARFVAERDSFYLASASADGQPYIQHRGGPRGFLAVLDETRLAFADYRGNRQYITVGNLSENPRAFIFLIDYPRRRRIKLWGRAEVIEDDPVLVAQLGSADYGVTVERVIVFHVEAWDVNCPQHITQRWTADELAAMATE